MKHTTPANEARRIVGVLKRQIERSERRLGLPPNQMLDAVVYVLAHETRKRLAKEPHPL